MTNKEKKVGTLQDAATGSDVLIGVSSKGFSAQTLDRFPKLENSNRQAIIAASREAYSTPKDVVEKEIAEWAGPVADDMASIPRRDDRPFDRPQTRPYNTNRPAGSYQDRPPMPRRDDRPSYGPPPRREERPYQPRREESRPQAPQNNNPPPKPHVNLPEKPKEALLSALSSAPVDFKGRKIQDRPRNNQKEKKEVDTTELKKLLAESLKKKE